MYLVFSAEYLAKKPRGWRPPKTVCNDPVPLWDVAKGSSVSWVAKLKGDKNSECKLSSGWSRSYKVINLLLSARK